MKVATTYDVSNGTVFQHFGHTPAFKVYEVEEGTVVGSQVFAVQGGGHGALSKLLADGGIQVLICGGLGAPAANAIKAQGIALYAGNAGDSDAIVARFAAGDLAQDEQANCGHHHSHHDEGHDCGDHAEMRPLRPMGAPFAPGVWGR